MASSVLYRLVDGRRNGTKLDVVLLRDYQLGTDFYPTIPRSFVDNALAVRPMTSRPASTDRVLNSPPECLSFFFQVTDPLFGPGRPARLGATFIANATETPPGAASHGGTGRPVRVQR